MDIQRRALTKTQIPKQTKRNHVVCAGLLEGSATELMREETLKKRRRHLREDAPEGILSEGRCTQDEVPKGE